MMSQVNIGNGIGYIRLYKIISSNKDGFQLPMRSQYWDIIIMYWILFAMNLVI